MQLKRVEAGERSWHQVFP
uniref:Uncharacterized protein n=1 Tax=Rhizophora mucronata TaxID=61149 RepID=A0A2P2PCL9_RHIMU